MFDYDMSKEHGYNGYIMKQLLKIKIAYWKDKNNGL